MRTIEYPSISELASEFQGADSQRKRVLFSKKRPSAFIRGQFGLKGATGQAESADLDAVVPSREVFARETNRASQFKTVGLLPV